MISTKSTPLTLAAALTSLTALTALTLAPGALAAKKAPAKKPAARTTAKKPVARPGGPIVLGTTQLPGDFGKFGTTYTIGTRTPINFTLNSAEYRSDRFIIGPTIWGNREAEKVLVLHYTVHNPLPHEQGLGWSALRFTAVDSQDTNHEYIQNTVRTGTDKEPVNMRLKPAQKVDITTAIVVPADGVIPKLIVTRENGAPVIRYDLRGKVKPIPAPFADPADPSGATPQKIAPVTMGAYYPTGVFDVKLDSVAYTTETLNRRKPANGTRYLTAIFTIKNACQSRRGYSWGTFKPFLKDADGEKVPYNQVALKASRDEAANGNLEPGEEARVRYFFPLPENVDAKSLTISESGGRALEFDVSGAGQGA